MMPPTSETDNQLILIEILKESEYVVIFWRLAQIPNII